jgi:hypothetical protein
MTNPRLRTGPSRADSQPAKDPRRTATLLLLETCPYDRPSMRPHIARTSLFGYGGVRGMLSSAASLANIGMVMVVDANSITFVHARAYPTLAESTPQSIKSVVTRQLDVISKHTRLGTSLGSIHLLERGGKTLDLQPTTTLSTP